jgi:hypothetical protein
MGVKHALDRFTMQACKFDQHRCDCRWPLNTSLSFNLQQRGTFAGRADPEETEGTGHGAHCSGVQNELGQVETYSDEHVKFD